MRALAERPTQALTSAGTTVRLQKFLAEAGVASRRAGEALILAGRVRVDGEVVRTLGTKVDPHHQQVSVDGRPLKAKRKLYVALHKPRGYVCTRRDPHGRQTVSDLLPREWRHLYPVGRLDRETEGLIFLTNDGEFALRLTHPRYGVRRTYVATVEGRLEAGALTELVHGVFDGGQKLRAVRARLLEANNSHSLVELELTEGKYREVRRLLAHVGHEVVALRRTRIGPIRLGELPVGKWRTLTGAELASLLRP